MVHLFVVGSFHLSTYTLQMVDVGRVAKTQGYKLRSIRHRVFCIYLASRRIHLLGVGYHF